MVKLLISVAAVVAVMSTSAMACGNHKGGKSGATASLSTKVVIVG